MRTSMHEQVFAFIGSYGYWGHGFFERAFRDAVWCEMANAL
jgi:hypothetical protein